MTLSFNTNSLDYYFLLQLKKNIYFTLLLLNPTTLPAIFYDKGGWFALFMKVISLPLNIKIYKLNSIQDLYFYEYASISSKSELKAQEMTFIS